MCVVTKVLKETPRSEMFFKGKLVTDWSYNCHQKCRKPKWMVILLLHPAKFFNFRPVPISSSFCKNRMELIFEPVPGGSKQFNRIFQIAPDPI